MRGHWVRYVVLLGITALLVHPGAAGAANSFCDEREVHDHLAPLKRLPKLNSPARLGFGPANLNLSTSPPLVVNEGRLGFRLRFGRGGETTALDWRATTHFERVDWRGRVTETLAVARKRIHGVRNSGIGYILEEGAEPGPYRMITVITDPDGNKLGQFGSYARLMPPTRQARLAISPGPHRPGETAWAQIENLGTATVSFGAPWRVERFNGGGWELAPESPRGPWILPLYFALPGHSSRECVANVTPSSPGYYRVIKQVNYLWPGGRLREEAGPADITAEFEVLP